MLFGSTVVMGIDEKKLLIHGVLPKNKKRVT
jgi:hypothetical protein